jgi:hypothetical protein
MAQKSRLLALVLFLLTGCATPFDAAPPSKAPNTQSVSLTLSPTEAAICNGQYKEVHTTLKAKSELPPKSQLLDAYAYELGGHPIKAISIYQSLGDNDQTTGPVSLKCTDKTHYAGDFHQIIAARIHIITTQLTEMGVRQSILTAPHHSGLPPTIKQTVQQTSTQNDPVPPSTNRVKKTAIEPQDQKPKAKNPFFKPLEVSLPDSVSTTGQWFAHIASYRTEENANSYHSKLEEQYPALKGNIQKWQIATSKGPTWRLGVRMIEWSDADRLCVIIRSKEEYCRVINTTQ